MLNSVEGSEAKDASEKWSEYSQEESRKCQESHGGTFRTHRHRWYRVLSSWKTNKMGNLKLADAVRA